MLGITERHGTAADINGFPDCINKLVTAIRNDIGEPNLPMLLTDYEQEATGMLGSTSAFATAIIPQINKVPDRRVATARSSRPRASACKTTITSTSTGTRHGRAALLRNHEGQGLVRSVRNDG